MASNAFERIRWAGVMSVALLAALACGDGNYGGPGGYAAAGGRGPSDGGLGGAGGSGADASGETGGGAAGACVIEAGPDASTVDSGGSGVSFVPSDALSCEGGSTCNGESCCTSIVVPGGTFPMGRSEVCGAADYDPGGAPTELPEHTMTVSTFALDKYEVTVGRFRRFVRAYAAGWRPAVGSGTNPNVTSGDTSWRAGWDDSGGEGVNLPATGTDAATTEATFASRLKPPTAFQTWTDAEGANENKAINCAGWYEAFAFCIWDGGRLPTEAEWEYAAAGGDQNRLYPWGSTEPDCTFANYTNNGSYCDPAGIGVVAPVGLYPPGNGRWGHMDLAGNLYEWTLDRYGPYDAAPRNNYANVSFEPNTGPPIRGGYFLHDRMTLRAAYRFGYVTAGYAIVGLRCARSAP